MKYRHVRLTAFNVEPAENGAIAIDARINYGELSFHQFMSGIIVPGARALYARMIPEPPDALIGGKVNPEFVAFQKRWYELPPIAAPAPLTRAQKWRASCEKRHAEQKAKLAKRRATYAKRKRARK